MVQIGILTEHNELAGIVCPAPQRVELQRAAKCVTRRGGLHPCHGVTMADTPLTIPLSSAAAPRSRRRARTPKPHYGFGAPRGLGTLSPYAGLTLSGTGAPTGRSGARWKLSANTSLALEGTREPGSGGEGADHAVTLRASVRF